MSAVPESVMSLLASLGFDPGQPGAPSNMVIDTFDHWSNPDSRFRMAPPTASGLYMNLSAEAAA
jgi:hypothetical protein